MTSGIVFVTIPYFTIFYLLYQEFLTVCAYPQSITGFLIVSAIPQLMFTVTILFIVKLFLNVLDITQHITTIYHMHHDSCFSYCLVLFVHIYSINHLLESAPPFLQNISRRLLLYQQLLQVTSISTLYHLSSSPII